MALADHARLRIHRHRMGLLCLTAVACALAAAEHSHALLFVSGGRRPTRSSVEIRAKPWQRRLDLAFLDVDAPPQARLFNLQKVLEDPSTVLQDVSRAASILAQQGFRKGHPEAIDTLFPKGTLARADLEGLQALRKQLPEVAKDLRNVSFDGQASSPPSLQQLASSFVELASDKKKQEEAVAEAKNIFRQKPRGLETPAYTVLRRLSDDIELRKYSSFTVAKQATDGKSSVGFSSGESFVKLADYLFGKNSQTASMQMTSPVGMTYGSENSMTFVLPKAFEEAPPTPLEDGIELSLVPECLVLTKAFPGVVTEGEVQRQRAALAEALTADENLQFVNTSEYSILQYNPPYTLPWRRLNELAVVVEASPDEAPQRKGEGTGK